MLDSSGSMQDPPTSGGALSKIDIAKTALSTLVTTVNPPDGSGGYTENARFGLFNFRQYGGLLVSPIQSGNTSSVLAGIAGQTAAGGVGTPLDGSILDVARYFNNQQDWGTLQKWGKDASEPAVTSPFDYSCRDSFVIFISDGLPTSDSMNHTGFHATIGDADGDQGIGEYTTNYWTGFSWAPLYEDNVLSVANASFEWADDISYVMYRRDFDTVLDGLQNITTHAIGFDIDLPLLENIADNGGGRYYTAGNATALSTALTDATQASFDALASYSTAVVPTSRSQFGSAFYNAYFEPDQSSPFWEGHLEAYTISPTGEILDKDGDPAVDPLTDLLIDPPNPHWDAGIVMRGQSTRAVYTSKGGNRILLNESNIGTAANQFNENDYGLLASEIGFFPNAAGSGISTLPQLAVALTRYLHGKDGFDEDNDSSYTEMRSKVLGDIFHSTPRIVAAPSTNLFGEAGYFDYFLDHLDRDRVIYTGANDGMLHAIDAGVYTVGDDPSTTELETVYYTPGSGQERFGYVPGLLLDDVKMVPRNNPRTYYFVDGSPVAGDIWIPEDASDVSKEKEEWTTILLTGFREGGEGYLALDVTEPGASALPHGPYPRLLWEFTDAKLGEAWSEPIITRVKVDDGNNNDNCGFNDGDGDCREHWVAIIGGGYDVSADPNTASFESNPANPGWTDRSKSIYMIDLTSGNVLARVEFDAVTNPSMIYALPSEPAVLDLNFDGFADVVYIGDVGGQIWKWDISAVGVDSNSDNEVDNWPSGVWFRTAPTAVASGNHYRSFFFPPSAAFQRGKLVLSFASGEREQLRYAGDALYSENNRMYVIKDLVPKGTGAIGTIYTEADLTDVTNKHLDDDPLDKGFYFETDDGEKFVSELIIFAGQVIGVTYDPGAASADPCLAISGTSNLYVFDLGTANGYFRNVLSTPMEGRRQSIGGGLASTPRVSIAPDPSNDKMYVKTSKGKVLTIDPPGRDTSGAGMIYWKQNF
jgi:type IV pilus assembly protein PilY1